LQFYKHLKGEPNKLSDIPADAVMDFLVSGGFEGSIPAGVRIAEQPAAEAIPKAAAKPAAPSASEIADLAGALKNTFGKRISQQEATERATAAVAKHPGDFDNAFREAVAPNVPPVRPPVPIAKPETQATPPPKPTTAPTFERTLANASAQRQLGSPDLGPPVRPITGAPTAGTPADIAQTRAIQDSIRNQMEREGQVTDLGQNRGFLAGNAVEQGKWSNVAEARNPGKSAAARVPYPRFTENLKDIRLAPTPAPALTPAATAPWGITEPSEDLTAILKKSLEQAKKLREAREQ